MSVPLQGSAPVSFFKNSQQAPIDLLNAIEYALNEVLGGDKAFTGYLAKNALSTAHEVYYTGAEPYTLHDLADYLDLPTFTPKKAPNDEFYGRNDAIFNTVRKIALSIAYTGTYTQIYAQCLEWCEEQNAKYSPQLPYNELKSISKSIAGHYVSEDFRRKFSNQQASRGSGKGVKPATHQMAVKQGQLSTVSSVSKPKNARIRHE